MTVTQPISAKFACSINLLNPPKTESRLLDHRRERRAGGCDTQAMTPIRYFV
jgi:hypothetical protein